MDDLAAALDRVVVEALTEDLGDVGDLTSLATIPDEATGRGRITSRRPGVVAGTGALEAVYDRVDPRVQIDLEVEDGETVQVGAVIAGVRGPLRAILTGERTALNLLGHLSGIASRTRRFVDLVADTGCEVRDTRKTTPGLRLLEKAAVRAGGGHNHRVGLHDALLVKDNHVLAAGGVVEAYRAAVDGSQGRHVQIEVDTLEQLERVLAAGATDVLLDNFTPEECVTAVGLNEGRATLEASGTITLETARAFADTGVDRIAVGALTHGAPWLDIGLDLTREA